MTATRDASALPPDLDVLALVRRYEPVLHYTTGEMFFPMAVDDYLSRAALWTADPAGGPATLVADHGQLDAERLSLAARRNPSAAMFLRFAPRSLKRQELREWRRRPDRPRFTGVSRLAAVGLLGRFIYFGMRASLTLRGSVPGGLTAASQQAYASVTPARDAYHAHVSTDGGYVVIQYWFLYAMNDWRTNFSGVNDHEGDWEQVTVYLVPAGPGAPGALSLAWVAFSSHDETGDELRRRCDDPDIGWVEGTHAIVNAGAGSHSGAYLAGDYLVRVQPAALARTFALVKTVRSVLFPWTRGRPSQGVGIPYVDYHRGDGVRIGPGTDRPWTANLIDSDTPWVRNFRGLWGLDTADPLGGERAPAGPRYERSGAIRVSWSDPVGWAGLDKVPPNPAAAASAEATRIRELDALIDELGQQITAGQDGLRQAAAGIEVLPRTATAGRRGVGTVQLDAQQRAVEDLRTRRRAAVNERDQLRQTHPGTQVADPHAHLRRRSVPDTTTSPNVLMRFWAGASLSVLFVLVGLALLLNRAPIFVAAILAVIVVMGIEALLRGRLLLFLAGLLILGLIGLTIWLLVTNLRVALGVLALLVALVMGLANMRTLLTRR